MSDSGLHVRGLGVRYGTATALRGVDFDLPPHSSIAVLGPNGAGKTTLARALVGLVRPAEGTILLDGRDITGWSPHRVARLAIAHIPETRGIFRGLSVADNLRMNLRRAVPRSELRDAIERAYEQFPILAARRRQPAGTLSGGEQQMLALARTFAAPPKVLIADEISLGLAPIIVESVFEQLALARRDGVALLVIEQFVEKALAICDEAMILGRGEVRWSGPAEEAVSMAGALYLAGGGGREAENPEDVP